MFGSLQALGMKLAAIALCVLPVAAGWLVFSAALGRTQSAAPPRRFGGGPRRLQDDTPLPTGFWRAGGRPAAGGDGPGATAAARRSRGRHAEFGRAAAGGRARHRPRLRPRRQANSAAASQVIVALDRGRRPGHRHGLVLRRRGERARPCIAARARQQLFVATKLEAPDAAELKRSLARLKTAKVDLLQLHNVRDPQQSLAPFKAWKAQGLCRYIGIASTFHGDFGAIETVLARERPDFVQIDYSLDDREAEERILPLAAEVKAGVLTALPFGHGRLFHAVRGRAIPDWATSFAGNWAQFFLKYLIGDPRVTVVIPGTADPTHMADNLGAMRGALPNQDERKRMVAFIEGL